MSSEDAEMLVPTELFDTMRSFCSVWVAVACVVEATALGVGDREGLGVAFVFIIRGMSSSRELFENRGLRLPEYSSISDSGFFSSSGVMSSS